MSGEKKGFVMYFDNCRKISHLPDESYAAVMRAITEYAERLAKERDQEAFLEQRLSALPPEAAMALCFMADAARRDHESYQETIHRRSRGTARNRQGDDGTKAARDFGGSQGKEDAWKYVT